MVSGRLLRAGRFRKPLKPSSHKRLGIVPQHHERMLRYPPDPRRARRLLRPLSPASHWRSSAHSFRGSQASGSQSHVEAHQQAVISKRRPKVRTARTIRTRSRRPSDGLKHAASGVVAADRIGR